MALPRSVYVHVPFCRHRCGYCNFTLVAQRDDLMDAYLRAIQIEIRQAPPAAIETLFIGGGTPTRLPIEKLQVLFDCLLDHFDCSRLSEWSVEANPLDITPDMVDYLASAGVTRISLGGQSFHPHKLRFLERDHDPDSLNRACELVRTRISNLSLDLIFGTPDESREVWLNDLTQALLNRPKHISTYGLTIEKGTRFWNRTLHQQVMQADEDTSAELYQTGIEHLASRGFLQYEVSNFCQSGFECRHNQAYWDCEEYFGFGPGAARFVQQERATNHQSTTTYMKRILSGQDPTVERESLDREQRAREILIFGLRQMKGIQPKEFQQRTGVAITDVVGDQIDKLLQQGFLETDPDTARIRLTPSGLLISDSLWPELL